MSDDEPKPESAPVAEESIKQDQLEASPPSGHENGAQKTPPKSREFVEQKDVRVTQQDRKSALLRDKAKKIEQERMKAAFAADDFDDLDDEPTTTTPEERGAKLRKARADRRKFLIKTAGFGVGGLVFIYLLYILFKPFTLNVDSGRKYTICKTFIELQTKYPTTIKYSRVEFLRSENSVEVLYSHVDPFGQYRMDSMRCTFRGQKEEELVKYNQIGQYTLSRIEYNKNPVSKEDLDQMNRSVYAILLGEIDYNYPRGFPNALRDLYFETDSFFKIQL